ncbi:hypothetical protein [Nonomuraea fuscirosea]|uniref:hypothetical protein n=1 Tax=Nonomuraea fuscirosea TaxID=1291556 RepID=UPI00343B88DE
MSALSVRLGGVCAVLGAVGYLAAGALHRDLPSGAENAVPHVAAHPEWHAICWPSSQWPSGRSPPPV